MVYAPTYYDFWRCLCTTFRSRIGFLIFLSRHLLTANGAVLHTTLQSGCPTA
jgi:hypothetical protein